MNIHYTKTQLEKEFKSAAKNIRQANKGLPWPVQIRKDYDLTFNENILSMRVHYLDGDMKYQCYNICL